MAAKDIKLPETVNMDVFIFSCWIIIIIFVAILVGVFIYIAYELGSITTKVRRGLDTLKKRFGKLGTALMGMADKAAITIENKVIPAIESLGPKIDTLIDESGVLAGEYMNVGIEYLRNQIMTVRSRVQQGFNNVQQIASTTQNVVSNVTSTGMAPIC